MSAFDDWYDPNDYRLSLMDPEYIAKEAFNAGMERAADMLDLNYPFCAKWIRKEISND